MPTRKNRETYLEAMQKFGYSRRDFMRFATYMAASGEQAEAAKRKTMEDYHGEYMLCVEGFVPLDDGGNYCCIAGHTAIDQHRSPLSAG